MSRDHRTAAMTDSLIDMTRRSLDCVDMSVQEAAEILVASGIPLSAVCDIIRRAQQPAEQEI